MAIPSISAADMDATLILLRGNSGSGKSSTARLLQRRLGPGTLLISQDAVRREMLWVKDGPGTPCLPLLIALARYGAEHCGTVIVEGILDAAVYEPLFRALTECFSRIHAYYYDIPFEETLRRHETKPNAHEFGADAMRRWWKERDYIGFIPETPLGPDVGQTEAVEMILAAISVPQE